MNREGVLELLAASALPGALKEYLSSSLRSRAPSSLRAYLKKSPVEFISGAEKLFTEAGVILGLPAEEALGAGGFDANNKAPGRLEAALAELRAVVFLRDNGYKELAFINRGTRRTADLYGVKGGEGGVFEVCCLKGTGGFFSAGLLALKYDRKICQVNSSRKKTGCLVGGLFFVSSPAAFGASGSARLEALAREVYEAKGSQPFTSVCLIAGGLCAAWPAL